MEAWVRVLSMVAAFALLVVVYLRQRRKVDTAVQRAAANPSAVDPLDESRHVHIDQEEMIDGSWDFFLPTLQQILRAEGVTFAPVISEREGEREVHLDGERLWRVDPTETSEEEASAGLVRLARAVNRRLEAARSPRRFYFLEGWNDLSGTLLQPEEYERLIAGEWGESLWNADDGLAVGAPIDARHLLMALAPTQGTRGGQFFYVRIPAAIGPIDRGRLYEDPLDEALAAEGLGSVSGGGTQLGADGSIVFCGIDVDVTDRDRGLACILRVMRELGAPEGTVVEEGGPEKVEHRVWGDAEARQLH
ncbi:MAG: hypothetical protein IPL19_06510 [Sandaracinaceae bacterium]|nr:hypothetical protein [Sandaracinaceae bacterium]